MLVGREAEQRQIDQLLTQATAGSSGLLVLRRSWHRENGAG